MRHPKIKVCMKQKKNFLKDIRALLRCGTRKRTNAFQIFKHRTPKVCPFVSFLKYKIIMLAKVSFNGENHLAIVLNERMGYDWLGEIKSSLLSFMESSFIGSENEFENGDLYNIMSLLREMDFTDNQRIAMYNNYFGKDNKEFQETKEATITF